MNLSLTAADVQLKERGFQRGGEPRFSFSSLPSTSVCAARNDRLVWLSAKKPATRDTVAGRAGLNMGKTMFAVIKTGGKQHKVAAEDTVSVMALPGEPGDKVTFGDVLMLVDGDDVTIGAPFVAGATVAAEIVEHERGPKVIAFKKRRRKNSKRKRGHRQDLTVVKIVEILAAGPSASRQSESPATGS